MRQLLSTHRFPALLAAACLLLPLCGTVAAEGGSVTLKVQGVLATRGESKIAPVVSPSLQPYTDVLKRFGFDKYEDIGGGSGSTKTGQATAIKVGSHTIEATLLQIDSGTAKLKYTVKDSTGHPLGSNAMTLAPGQIVPIQIGEPAFPIILLFQLSK